MLDLACVILAARERAQAQGCLATVGKVRVEPNAVNADPVAGHGLAGRAWARSRAPCAGWWARWQRVAAPPR
jgi:hypothetical protein